MIRQTVMANVEACGEIAGADKEFEAVPDLGPPVTFLLVKLASRCNIDCTYCYWFRDPEVYRKPAVLTREAEDVFCARLEHHIETYGLDHFLVIYHGGEPLLFPKHRFVTLQNKLRGIEERTGCQIARAVSTNAILIDPEWARILKTHEVSVSVSIDGPAEIHDKNRIDFKGRGTLADTLAGLACLRAEGIEPGLISVCNPSTDPEQILTYAVEELGVRQFDILPPDATHADDPPPIADYYVKLFDVWYDKYAHKGVRIRTLDAMIHGLVGNLSVSDTVGIGPTDTVTLMTDGSLEPLDVLRIAGEGSTKTGITVFHNEIQDIQGDPRWREALEASLQLCDTCKACEYVDSCGGGHVAHRWSDARRFDNPSVYCDSWKRIFGHIWQRISPTLTIAYDERAIAADRDHAIGPASGQPAAAQP